MKLIRTLLFVSLLSASSFAQNTGTGTPTFGSFTGGTPLDLVNNQNLNVHVNIPFIGLTGRGTGFSFSEINDSQIWAPVTSGGTISWTPVVDNNGNPTWGWQTASPTGSVSYVLSATGGTCDVILPSGIHVSDPLFRRNNWVYTDVQGTQHHFPGVDLTDACINHNVVPQATSGFSASGYPSDPSGLFLVGSTVTTFPSGFTPLGTVNGVVTDGNGFQRYGVSWEGYIEDTNGNYISTTTTNSGHVWTDTTGTNALTVVPSSSSVQYKDRNGTVIITVNLQTLNIKTNFGCSGVVEYSGTATVPSSIAFPNNQTISFSYEPTPGNSGFFTGRLQKITLPNGGFYEYDYGTTHDGINCSDGTTTNLTRKINDGTNTQSWNFNRAGSNTTVTSPKLSYDSMGNDTVYGFDANGHQSSRKTYQGSSSSGSLLQTVNTTWASNGTPATNVTILEDGNTQSETDTTYDSNGLLQILSSYDFGNSAHGALIKTISNTYLASSNSSYAARNLLGLVSEVKIQDASGAVKSRAQFKYDETALATNACPAGVAQHDDTNYPCSFNIRGNTTSVIAYKDPVTPANPVTRGFTYDWFGNTLSAQVSCCQQKSWVFSATTNYSFPDNITSGASGGPQLTQQFTYNGPGDGPLGLVKNFTDENGQITKYQYDGIGRVTLTTLPDNTQLSYSYDDTQHTATSTTPVDSTHSAQEVRTADSLGRLSLVTTQDSGGAITPSNIQYGYDELGRAASISNPYTGTSPSFFTTTQFDPLGRPTKTILPDSQQTTFSYATQYMTLTDPTGKQIRRKFDAAGRLVEVDEPNTSLSGAFANANVTISGTLNSIITTVSGNAPTATTGSALTSFVASDGSSHSFYMGSNQHIYHLFWNSSGGWQDQDVSAAANNALAASGSPLTSFPTSDGNYHVVYLDTNQHVNQLASSGTSWSNQDITAASGGAAASSSSSLTGYAGGYSPHIYYQGSNQHIYQYWLNGSSWVSNDLTAGSGTSVIAAAGTHLTSFLDSSGEHSVYVGQNNHIYQLFWNGLILANQDLTDMAALDLVDGPCAPENGICYGSGTQTVGFGANGAYSFVTATGNVNCNVATFGDPAPGVTKACYLVSAGFPVAVAGSAVSSLVNSDGEHIYYLTSNEHNHHLLFDGENWHDQDQTSFAGTSVVAASGSALSTFGISSDISEHTVYLGTNKHVYQMLYSSTMDWVNQDLTSLSGATATAAAGSALTSFGLSAGNPGHIQYLDSNGHVNHLYFDGSAWHNQDLMTIAANQQTVFDSGLVSLTVSGFTATACFGPSTNPACTNQQGDNSTSTVATALAQALSASGSPVNASASGAVLTLTMKAGGYNTSTVNPLRTTHDNSTLFSIPSFTSAATTFSGGSNYSPASDNPYVTTYAYNVLDKIVTITQGAQTRTINYDALGRETSEVTPEAGTVSFIHNDFGLPTQRTDNRGVVTTYTYDQLNRLTSKSYPTVPTGVAAMPNNVCDPTSPTGTNKTANTCFYYDQGGSSVFALGRLSMVVDSSGSATNAYDSLGRITQISKVITGTNGGNAYVSYYQYNLASEITQIQYPSGRQVKPSFDALGRISGLADTMNGVNTTYASAIQYNAAEQMTGFTYGNGITATYGYSSDRLQLTSISYAKSGQIVFGLNYSYTQNGGNSGTITGITDNVDKGRSLSYVYDALGRLQQASTAGSTNFPKWDLAFGYDRYGNRLTETAQSDTSPNISVPSNTVTVSTTTNQITTSGYSYDAAGNITNDGVNGLTYDAENRATSSSGIGGTATYVYDTTGLRVRKCVPNCTSPTSSTAYIFYGKTVIAEYDNNATAGSPSREYINSTKGLLAMIDSNGTKYHMRDHLSVRMTTDTNGNKIGEQAHFPFGESWYSSNTTSKWAFTSFERDPESGNDYASARFYVSRLARFNSPDSLPGSPNYPQTLNRYAYVVNDPINLIDPSGKDCIGGTEFDFVRPVGMGEPDEEDPTTVDEALAQGWTLVDESTFFVCFPDPGAGGGAIGEGGGGAGTGKVGPGTQVNIKALADCLFAIFGVTLVSFTPTEPGENGSFTGFGADQRSNDGLNYNEITVTNSLSKNKGTLTLYAKMSGVNVPPGYQVIGYTPPDAPSTNYTANDIDPNKFLSVQIKELGNSLGIITNNFPEVINNNPNDPANNEPGTELRNCYNNGGPWQSGANK